MIAENRFELNEDLFLEGFSAIQGNYRRFVRWLIVALVLLWLALAAFTLLRGENFLLAIIELVVLGLVGLYAGWFLPRRKAKAAYEAVLRRTGGAGTRVTRFYGDHLEADAGTETVALAYGDVQSKQELPRLLILVGGDKRGFMIKKDAFTQGSLETVLSAIETANGEEKQHD